MDLDTICMLNIQNNYLHALPVPLVYILHGMNPLVYMPHLYESLGSWYTCSPCMNPLVYTLTLYESLGIQAPLL